MIYVPRMTAESLMNALKYDGHEPCKTDTIQGRDNYYFNFPLSETFLVVTEDGNLFWEFQIYRLRGGGYIKSFTRYDEFLLYDITLGTVECDTSIDVYNTRNESALVILKHWRLHKERLVHRNIRGRFDEWASRPGGPVFWAGLREIQKLNKELLF